MANLFTSAPSSFLILRRDLEDVLDEMELPWRVRREMDRLFAESTSPMSLWRNVEYLLEDFAAPIVVRRRIESVFARFLSGGNGSFNTLNGMNQSHFTHAQHPFTNTHFTQGYGSQFGQNPYLTNSMFTQNQNPFFTQSYGSQFGQNPYLTQSYGSQFGQNPYLTQSYGSQFGQNPYLTNSMFTQNQNPYFTQSYGSQFGQNPYLTNSMFAQNQNFTGREHSAWFNSPRSEWFTSPRNEWSSTGRFNDGFVPVRNSTRGNSFGQFGQFGNSLGNTFGGVGVGNAWGPTNSMFGGNTFGSTLGSSFGGVGNSFGGVGNSMFGGNSTFGPYGNTFGGNSTFGPYGNAIGGINTHGQWGNAIGSNSQFGNSQFGNSQFGNAAFAGNTAFGSQFQDFVPPVELIERDGEFVVRVELAGVREQDVEIRANEHILTIRGERRERFDNEVARHVGAYEYSERRYGTFTRTVTLPQGIDAAHIHAVFRDGVLELRIPQAETYRARRIPIGRIDEQRVVNDGQGVHVRPHVS